jgi:hypothetical protein
MVRLAKNKVAEESPPAGSQEAVEAFEKEIAAQENILYGLALFFEGISMLYADAPDLIEAQRRQFGDMILAGRTSVDQARALLDDVKRNPVKAGQLAGHTFSPCAGHPQAAEMVKRARIMVRAYEETFPNRARSQPFNDAETFRLMEAASQKLD